MTATARTRQPLPRLKPEIDQAARLIALLDALAALPRDAAVTNLFERALYIGAETTVRSWATSRDLKVEVRDGALYVKRDAVYDLVCVSLAGADIEPRLPIDADHPWRPSDEPRWVSERTTALDDRGAEVVTIEVSR